MMKKLIVVIFALIILGIASFLLFSTQTQKKSPSFPTPTAIPTTISNITSPTVIQQSYCLTNQLDARITTEGAAGSIYGNLILTNVGKSKCKINLGNTVSANYSANNIELKYQQTITPEVFDLLPNSSAYSQVRIPNGPQCQSEVLPKPVSFVYKTEENPIIFKTQEGKNTVIVQSCKNQSDITTITIWPLSKTPISQ